MPLTIESLTEQLNQLHQQRTAAANMVQQCAGAIGIVQKQIMELQKEKEAELKKEAEQKEEEPKN